MYDALYRLTEATGREHIGQSTPNGSEQRPDLKPHYDFNDSTRLNLPHPNNVQAMRDYTERYKYDAVGNILAMIHGSSWRRSYSYAADSNRLLSTSLPGDLENGPLPQRYFYDANGNMIQMPHLEGMKWDYKDQLRATQKQAVNDGNSAEKTYYVYDSAGQRVRKVTERANETPKDERIYLGGFELYRAYNGDGSSLKVERETLHVMDGEKRIALVETQTVKEENGVSRKLGSPKPIILYQLGNHLGSASLELDGGGNVISYEEYYPYGSTSYQAGRSVAEVGLKRYRYTGKERDGETGLYYHGARYYAAWLGRWVSCDPDGVNSGINLYVYTSNNPTGRVDPNGKSDEPVGNTGDRSDPRNYADFDTYLSQQPKVIPIDVLQSKWDAAHTPQLMKRYPYNERVESRENLGKNVQKDHPIQISLRASQRGRTGEEQRQVSSQRRELTILVETGKGLFHTELGKLQKIIRERAKAGLIKNESQLIEETREAYHLAARITNTVVDDTELDAALISNLGVQSETYEQTRKELSKATGQTTLTDESIDKAFHDESQKNNSDSNYEASTAANLIVLALGAYFAAYAVEGIGLLAEGGTVVEEATVSQGVRIRVADEVRIRVADEVRIRVADEVLKKSEEVLIEEGTKEALKRMTIPR